mmetsp:Transcript_6299/g.6187  ORF Transcript_6299/g.6187 Transcript_6299/m.6187 type:complete len:591 (+) Transcript_6299:246-2018(+)
MAAMRLCSAKKQGLPIVKENYMKEQNILARKRRESLQAAQKLPDKPESEENKSGTSSEGDQKVKSADRASSDSKINEMLPKMEEAKERRIIEKNYLEEEKIKINDISAGESNAMIEKKQNFLQMRPENSKKIAADEELANNLEKNRRKSLENPTEIPLQISLEIPNNNEKYMHARSLTTPNPSPIPDPNASRIPSNVNKIPIKMPSIPKLYVSPLGRIDEEGSGNSSNSKDPDITVENPTLISSGWFGSTSYYVYTVTTRANGKIYSVKRRFNDLDWMHSLLIEKYKGFIIPPRPEKAYIKNMTEKFLEERRSQMEKYLNIIAKHPILGSSTAFKVFTQTPNEKFEREKQKAEESHESLEFKSLEDAYDQVVSIVQNKLQIMLSQKIMPFSKEMSNIEDKVLKIEAPIQSLSASFSNWTQRQFDSLKSFESFMIPDLPDFNDLIRRYKTIAHANINDLNKLSLEFHEEFLRLEGLKQAINSYKGTLDEYSQQETLISRKLSKHKSSSDEDTAARYLSEIQKTQDNLDRINKNISQIEENLEKENASLDENRRVHLVETITEIARNQKKYYESASTFWQDALYSLEIPKEI